MGTTATEKHAKSRCQSTDQIVAEQSLFQKAPVDRELLVLVI